MAKVFAASTISTLTTNLGNADRLLRDQSAKPIYYITGTVATSSGSPTIAGTSTVWTSLNFNSSTAPARIGIGSNDASLITTWYTISAVGSDNSLTISTTYGSNSTLQPYVIQMASKPTVVDTIYSNTYEFNFFNRLLLGDVLAENDITDSDTDSTSTLLKSFRTNEGTLTSALSSSLTAYQTALDNYFISITTKTLRNYFTGLDSNGLTPAVLNVSWSENYRRFHRNIKNEELIVKLYSLTNTGGTWGSLTSVSSVLGMIGATLEVRLASDSTQVSSVTPIILNVVPIKADGTNDATIVLTIPVNSAANAQITFSTNKYIGISSVTVASGGSAGNKVEFWVK
jgi:hypothetical protein